MLATKGLKGQFTKLFSENQANVGPKQPYEVETIHSQRTIFSGGMA
jgi:hypothetical protein